MEYLVDLVSAKMDLLMISETKIKGTFKHQFYKMVKHTQTIRRLMPTDCLSVLEQFVGLALKGLNIPRITIYH